MENQTANSEFPNTSHSMEGILPLWQRIVFAAVIPTAIVIAGGILVRINWGSIYELLGLPVAGPDSGPGAIFILIALLFYAALRVFEFLLIALIFACNLRIVFLPWKYWYTAIGGGIGGAFVGSMFVGALCYALYLVLTS